MKLVQLVPAVVQVVLVLLAKPEHLVWLVNPVLEATRVIRETEEMVEKTEKKDHPVPKDQLVPLESVVCQVFPVNVVNPVDEEKMENAAPRDLPVKPVPWVDVVPLGHVVLADNLVIPVLWV